MVLQYLVCHLKCFYHLSCAPVSSVKQKPVLSAVEGSVFK